MTTFWTAVGVFAGYLVGVLVVAAIEEQRETRRVRELMRILTDPGHPINVERRAFLKRIADNEPKNPMLN